MYVTGRNDMLRARCRARAARSGTTAGARTPGRVAEANRGVAVAGDRVFMVTDDAHLIALNRFNGDAGLGHRDGGLAPELLRLLGAAGDVGTWWSRASAAASTVPAASSRRTIRRPGKEAWRFWTVPKAGRAGVGNVEGKGIEHRGAPTWFTGTYDPAADTVYWPTGNPAADIRRRPRRRQPVLRLHPGARSEDREAEVVLPVHAARPVGLGRHRDAGAGRCQLGRAPRKLLLQGNRNGFFYVFDRTNGKLLLANNSSES